MTGAAKQDSRQLEWLDYARYVAAMAVLFYHYLANGPRAGKTGSHIDFGVASSIAEYGYLGVDLFFIVSGYVVLYSALGREADRFVVSRFVRLWPTFLICMTLTAIVRAFAPPAADAVGLTQYLGNLTMIPAWLGVKPIDGVYWTLAYELLFYAAVFVVLLIGKLRRLTGLIIGWTVLLVAMRLGFRLLDLPSVPLLGDYYELFAAGALLAVVRDRGWKTWSVACMAVLVALCVDGAVGRATVMAAGRPLEPWIAGLLVALMFAPFLVIRGSGPRLPWARHLGRITYPLYLLHAQIGFAILKQLPGNDWLVVAITTVAVTALAVLVYLGFEETTHGLRIRMADVTLGAAVRWVQRLMPWTKAASYRTPL
jgi:peptidoglycan/LPS O-acetylase OafA/YrhL